MRSLITALCGSFLLLTACGGGGGATLGSTDAGDDGPELFTLSGAYHTTAFLTTRGGNLAFFGQGTADLIGAFRGSVTGNQDEVVTPGGPFEQEYTVDPDGCLQFLGIGTMSDDSTLGAVWLVSGMNVLLRRGGSFDAASLDATYRFVAKLGSSTGAMLSTGGTLVLDGVGGATLTPEFLNNEGSHVSPTAETGSYTVTPDGEVVLDLGILTLVGGVARDGELIALAGGRTNGQQPMALYAVRQGTGRSRSLLQGRYGFMLDHLAQTTHDALGMYGLLDADGTGTARLSERLSAIPTGLEDFPIPITVAPDGQIDVTLLGGHRFRGALSASGDIALLVGGIDDGFDPALLALIRKRALPATNDITLDVTHSASIPRTVLPAPVGVPRLTPVISSRHLIVGESRTRAAIFETEGTRSALRFDLRALQPGRTVARAVLTTTQSSVEFAPYSLGALQVDHVSFGIDIEPTDYDAPLRPLGTLGSLSDQPTLGTLSLDVTAAVLADLAEARTTSDFLLRFDTEQNGDPLLDRVVLDDHTGPGSSTGPRTRLVITYQ